MSFQSGALSKCLFSSVVSRNSGINGLTILMCLYCRSFRILCTCFDCLREGLGVICSWNWKNRDKWLSQLLYIWFTSFYSSILITIITNFLLPESAISTPNKPMCLFYELALYESFSNPLNSTFLLLFYASEPPNNSGNKENSLLAGSPSRKLWAHPVLHLKMDM